MLGTGRGCLVANRVLSFVDGEGRQCRREQQRSSDGKGQRVGAGNIVKYPCEVYADERSDLVAEKRDAGDGGEGPQPVDVGGE